MHKTFMKNRWFVGVDVGEYSEVEEQHHGVDNILGVDGHLEVEDTGVDGE